jgi:hypothetical protein
MVLELENTLNTISRRSFLAELYKDPDLHPIIPLVDMIYSRDSKMCYFDSNDASFLFGAVQSRTGVRQGVLLGRFLSTWRSAPTLEYWGTVQGFFGVRDEHGAWFERRKLDSYTR